MFFFSKPKEVFADLLSCRTGLLISPKETSFGLAKLCSTIENTMDKTLQTMIRATDIVFFEALTAVSGFDTNVFISQTKVPVSKTMGSTSDKIIWATYTTVSVDETIVFANEKIFVASDTIFFTTESIFSVAGKTVREAPAALLGTATDELE
jgi:hypothetical protein